MRHQYQAIVQRQMLELAAESLTSRRPMKGQIQLRTLFRLVKLLDVTHDPGNSTDGNHKGSCILTQEPRKSQKLVSALWTGRCWNVCEIHVIDQVGNVVERKPVIQAAVDISILIAT